MSTKIFLAYYDEDISEYNHPNIIPIKLNQTEYFESEIFRMITPSMIPNVDNIGMITPSFFKKVPGVTLDSLFNKVPNPFTKLLLWREHIPCDFLATQCHGEMYMVIMSWLLKELNIPISIINRYKGFYCNMWITKREIFLEYLELAKKAIKCIDSAPPNIKLALSTDPNYNGKLKETGILEKRFGKSYYPWQPFIMERLICAFAYTKQASS
jgi:hypothetical protein